MDHHGAHRWRSGEIPYAWQQRSAWQVFEGWTKPFVCCFSDRDPITRGGDVPWLSRVPGTKGQPHTTLHGGHFVQEDDPDGFVRVILGAPA